MHEIIDDRQWRGPTDAVTFKRTCENNHSLAQKLEKQGIKTSGINDELYACLKINKHPLLIQPSWRYIDCWGSHPSGKDPYDVNIMIPAVGVTIPVKLAKIKKTFESKTYLVKALTEYSAALAAAKSKKAKKSVDLAYTSIIESAQALDEA